MSERPRVLIEDWLPVEELGIESRREAAPIPGQFPKLKTLHVWWARRPLAASAGAVLGSLMPSWSTDLAAAFGESPELQDPETYRRWFLRLCGIIGDPVAAKRRAEHNRLNGVRTTENPYDYKPAFRNRLGSADLALLQRVLERPWGGRPTLVDPTAGGGSIPYTATRYGIDTVANDLNPVAAAVLYASVELAASYGDELLSGIRGVGQILTDRVAERLAPYFPARPQERIANYIFARTVRCPRDNHVVPLSPNWWLSSGDKPVAVRIRTHTAGRPLDRVLYEIEVGEAIDFDPSRGTFSGGDATCPWDGLAIDGDYIKTEARAGRMGSDLYAVVIRASKGRQFRAPTDLDRAGLAAAETALVATEEQWVRETTIPSEDIDPVSNYERGHMLYGIHRWRDMFSPRQLLVHGTFVEEFRRIVPEARERLGLRAEPVLALLALMQAKAINFDGIQSSWDTTRDKMRSVFDSHNFAFKWTYAEFEGSGELYPWCLDQIVDAYEEISTLLRPADAGALAVPTSWPIPGPTRVTCQTAADLDRLADRSAAVVCIDPPYYDNVMYAELSDFFYVWEKRTLGLLRPDLYTSELADKKNEAVANLARFADAGRRKKELATADYEAKMASIFAECARILRDDGVLTVMFTHKRAEAWDTLGMGLLEAGFRIETSWPVNTESEQSLHQANKNAAASTIFLVCRKRAPHGGRPPFFEDVEGDVRIATREAVARFSSAGLSGVDLLLSTYGPALSVISAKWPVYSSEADPLTGRSRLLRPEEALDAARSEVVRLQRRRLVGTDAQFDPLTDFALIAWETFKAAEFPYDEARRLALATGGLDVDELVKAKILEKKAGTVVLLPPERRARRPGDDEVPGVRPDATSFPVTIDAVHTVMYVADTDGLPAARALIDRAGLASDARSLAGLQGLVNAIPRTRTKSGWVRKEAATLDRLCAAYFPEIVMPKEPETVERLELWS
jgi:putative DNA methylase